ncbi:MAG TPA: M23 family metallopeptidase [Candidatus Ozemobacteraceae bacterium]|nr:M23 family metallopeptidase [Candidatus Ozemobacteraceae bacterium]HQG27972.1 M23 family metallopeptidase [Candidatus Ozemobacteraceae bacterium]
MASFCIRQVIPVVLSLFLCVCPSSAADYYTEHPAPPFHSTTLQETSPVQTAAAAFPNQLSWRMNELPSISTYRVAFSGKPENPASHEGIDFVHDDPAVKHVPVVAADKGTIAYVRTGAPQSSMFQHNTSLREAGAGWGNHVVVYHGNGIYTRYAHLAPGTVTCKVGDTVIPGDVLGEMGNSGRSETRHLHFEVGYKTSFFVPSKPAQSFELVLDPTKCFPPKSERTPNPSED